MLIIDFVSIFPFYLFADSGDNSSAFIRLLRMARLARIVRASRITKILNAFSRSEKISAFFSAHQGLARLISGIVLVMILAHFSACMWYYSSKLDGFKYDTWVVSNGLIDKPNGHLYLASIY